ncbi:MAG: HAD family hydrolase [Candidatus Latescibacteria bacterium]|nr:HAD family hydrolase [Candidatus Latescibacterota bacterium]
MALDTWPQLLCLDLDDTIIAYTEGAEASWRFLCEKYAARTPGLGAETFGRATDEVRAWYWSDPERHRQGRLDLLAARRQILALTFARLQRPLPDWAEEMAAEYTTSREQGVQPFPGALEALARLRRQSRHLALITNGHPRAQRHKIDRLALAPFFDYILVEGEFGAGKPDEQVYRHVLAYFGVEAGAAWMVGDNLEWDVAAPQRLGMGGIWVDYAGKGLPPGSNTRPDRTIRHLAELLPA